MLRMLRDFANSSRKFVGKFVALSFLKTHEIGSHLIEFQTSYIGRKSKVVNFISLTTESELRNAQYPHLTV